MTEKRHTRPDRRTVLKMVGGSATGTGLIVSSGTAAAGVHPTSFDITIHYDSEANSKIECNNHCTMQEIAEYTAGTTEGNFRRSVDYASANATTEETTTSDVESYDGGFKDYIYSTRTVEQSDVHIWQFDNDQWDVSQSTADPAGAVDGLGTEHSPFAYVCTYGRDDNTINETTQHETGHLFAYQGDDGSGKKLKDHKIYNYDEYCNVTCMNPGVLKYCPSLRQSWVHYKHFGKTLGKVISHGLKHDEVYTDGPDYIYDGGECQEEKEYCDDN